MRGTPSGDAYLDLQNQARRTRRQTQELLQLYVLEGFLARLAASAMRERLVLKGGILLAAFGSRRPTRDVDLPDATSPTTPPPCWNWCAPFSPSSR
jgi:Nucleotidyl transferase AbiEii toxin, Type IV TA system